MRNNLHFTIQQYLNGTLNPKAMHELEKQALEDEFLAEALEGYHSVKASQVHMSLLQHQLQSRIAKQQVQKVAVSVSARRLSIAAVAGLILILGSILFWMLAFEENTASGSTERPASSFVQVVSGSALPVSGWEEYGRYLKRGMKGSGLEKTQGETITLEFTVNGNRASGVRTISKGSASVNAKAIQLIKEGPEWKGAGKVRLNINYKN